MRLLVDENVPLGSIRVLRSSGLDVFSIMENCRGCPDTLVLQKARETGAIVVTFDRDFGGMVFHEMEEPVEGVVLFRFTPKYPEEPAEILLSILEREEIELPGKFTVIDRNKVRQRSLPEK